jgi:hypothetical protein
MHVFDDPDQAVDSGDAFEKVLSELFIPSTEPHTPQMISELDTFWMALGVLCPNTVRTEICAAAERPGFDAHRAALSLRIPERYIPFLISDKYMRKLGEILSRSPL